MICRRSRQKAWALAYPFPGITSASKAVGGDLRLFFAPAKSSIMTDGVIKIAVADDHERFRKALCTHLTRMGFKVVLEASDGRELLHYLKTATIRPAVVMVDVHMPVIDGVGAIRQIRAQWPELAVLAISIDNDPQTAQAAIDAGANGFIAKGGNPEELKSILIQLI